MASSTSPPEKLPLSRGQVTLRIVGGALLAMCVLMIALGTTVLGNHLQGTRFLVYWAGCLLLAGAAIIIAIWDMLLVRRISRHTRRELFQRQFMRGNLADKLRDSRNP